jgi:hypothetical protein
LPRVNSHMSHTLSSSAKGPSPDGNISTKVFLNHSQMRLESLQIDFECTRNPEQPHVRFNFGNSLLILDQSGPDAIGLYGERRAICKCEARIRSEGSASQ